MKKLNKIKIIFINGKNIKKKIKNKMNNYYSLIYLLKRKKPEKIIKLFINENIDVNKKDNNGNALIYALKYGSPENIIKLSINENTDFNKKDNKSYSD